MTELTFDPRTTALVVVDLQRGIVSRDVAPHASRDVVARAARVADAMRGSGGYVVLVRVAYAADGADRLQLPIDSPMAGGAMPRDWSDIVPELGPRENDLIVTKHQWGGFYGTELDLQLRRRGIRTLLLSGISTNFGVESTARDGWERGYAIVFIEDAMAAMSAEAHAFAIGTIFPRIGRVRSSADVLAALTVKR